jgi:hypothetical protein
VLGEVQPADGGELFRIEHLLTLGMDRSASLGGHTRSRSARRVQNEPATASAAGA